MSEMLRRSLGETIAVEAVLAAGRGQIKAAPTSSKRRYSILR